MILKETAHILVPLLFAGPVRRKYGMCDACNEHQRIIVESDIYDICDISGARFLQHQLHGYRQAPAFDHLFDVVLHVLPAH